MCFLGAVSMVIGAVIRVQCFREMGKHFTFSVTLLKDHKLFTSDPYSYIRHPSYTGGFLSMAWTSDLVHSSGFMTEREGGSQDTIGMAHSGPSDSDRSLNRFTWAPKDTCREWDIEEDLWKGKGMGRMGYSEMFLVELFQEFIDVRFQLVSRSALESLYLCPVPSLSSGRQVWPSRGLWSRRCSFFKSDTVVVQGSS